jgi:hypothetical protein
VSPDDDPIAPVLFIFGSHCRCPWCDLEAAIATRKSRGYAFPDSSRTKSLHGPKEPRANGSIGRSRLISIGISGITFVSCGPHGFCDHSVSLLSALAAPTDWTRSTGCGTRSRYYRRTQAMWRTVVRRHLPGAITTVVRSVAAS